MNILANVVASVLLTVSAQDGAPTRARVDELIKQIGSDVAEARNRALDELQKMGKAAVPLIKEALPEVKDPEVQARINHLLRKLEPPALEALQEYLERAKIDVVAMDVVKDDVVGKILPDVIFFQVWKRGQTAAWKVLGYDTTKKELFDATETAAWTGYLQVPERRGIALEKAFHQIKVAAAAPHAAIVAYSGAPTLNLFVKIENRTVWVKADGHTLEARSFDGKPIWTVDVEPICGGNIGAPVVRHLREVRGGVSLVFGKHSHATVDLETGKVFNAGSD